MYRYEDLKPSVFLEENQKQFLSIRSNAIRLCKESGCAMMENIISGQTGDTWVMIACVDRLKELGELVEIPNTVSPAGSYRIFALGDAR